MAPRKKAEEAPVEVAQEAAPKKTRKRAAAPADAPMAADTTTSTPGNPTVCKTCNGHGATDIVPMNARNTEAHYNKYGQSLRMGVGGGSHMGAKCPACSGGGFGR
jgi:DnaJ-class molecular chaperone